MRFNVMAQYVTEKMLSWCLLAETHNAKCCNITSRNCAELQTIVANAETTCGQYYYVITIGGDYNLFFSLVAHVTLHLKTSC